MRSPDERLPAVIVYRILFSDRPGAAGLDRRILPPAEAVRRRRRDNPAPVRDDFQGEEATDPQGEFTENLTIEQVFASAVQKTLRQKLYTVVDQRRELAPPGPVYLKAPNDNWQDPVLKLMQRAYAVILWLPAGQDLRPSFSWEIEQIVRAGLQRRTIIVLPSPNDKVAYRRAGQQAAVLLAALEMATGDTTQVNPLRVRHYEDMVGDKTLTMKFIAAPDGDGLQLIRRWIAEPPRLTWQRLLKNVLLSWLLAWYGMAVLWDRRRNGRVNVLAYEQGVTYFLASIRKLMANQPFSARYPNHESASGAETAPGRQSADPLES